ncbi:MAG: histidine kinase [Pirellula sp.]|nr:histidine kinase [Pirellula sp.]
MLASQLQTDVTPQQLRRYAQLVYQKIGVTISEQKTTLLSNRLRRRLRATGLKCYDDYYELLCRTSTADAEWEAFLQEVTTHETFLFRDKTHWDWIHGVFLPELMAQVRAGKRRPTLRVWSAACSTGDEATSVACCAADKLSPLANWKVEIVGTDVGCGAVAAAQRGEFSERAVRLVPESMRKRFFEHAPGSPIWSSKPVLRDMLRFTTHNLLEPSREAPFDLVLLKNVLIYFDAASKKKVLDQVRRVIRPGGVLITGAAEGVSELVRDLETTHGWLHRIPTTTKTGVKS